MSTTKKKKQATPKGVKVTKEHSFKLTEAEFNLKGKEAAKARAGAFALELQFDEVKEGWKAKIRVQENIRDAALDVIQAGEEKRTVETTMVKDFDAKEIQYWFEGVVLESRTMTANELQQEFPLDPKRGEKARAVKQAIQGKDRNFNEANGMPDPIAAAQTGNGKFSDIAEVHKIETKRQTKSSAVDGPTKHHN